MPTLPDFARRSKLRKLPPSLSFGGQVVGQAGVPPVPYVTEMLQKAHCVVFVRNID